MNETLKVLDDRRSLRGYDSREISEEHKKSILHSTFRAPTAGNMMHYSIIEVACQQYFMSFYFVLYEGNTKYYYLIEFNKQGFFYL